MGKALVIVESPTKARTIARFIGDDYVVESSIGHVRDLPQSAKDIPEEVKKEPWSRLGIDVDNGFKPLYIVPPEKKQQVAKLKSLLKDADRLYLATDEDREGESISWHLLEVLKPKVPTVRLVFHEITREAIQHALANPRAIDAGLVRAQETRRVLDRLVGYEVSPVLWRKIAPALSAGRVQSVAVRLIVNRERERLNFRQAVYWDLAGLFRGERGEQFRATLTTLRNRRVATGKDFDDATGQLLPARREVTALNEADAEALRGRLATAAWQVSRVERKPFTSRPSAPFTTSTLQQEGNRKLSLSSRDTMRLAQGLYERGYITYMRTDSTILSDQAVQAARSQISALYGPESLPAQPRVYATKVKNAQEAHEAIRPAGEEFRTPAAVRGELESHEWRLYEMIWKRTVASQMADARGQRVVLNVEAQAEQAVFQATGQTIEFPGFLRAYVEGSDDPDAELGDQERILPDLEVGEAAHNDGLEALAHRTQPPARYSEAALIKELEGQGIGRPSTYASIIDTIIRRDYVSKKGSQLVPSFTAIAVVRLLEQYFSHLVDVAFTAQMENALDAISRGEQESGPYLERFYHGDATLLGLKTLIKAEIDARTACTLPVADDEDHQPPITVRIGRYGPYLERETERASLPVDITPDEVTWARADDLLKRGSVPDVLGTDPASGLVVYLKNGRFGPYVQLGEKVDGGPAPKMKSLLPGQIPEQLTLDDALQLLSLPREVGVDPETGEPILTDLGRFGPYARRGKDSRTLPTPEALFTLTLPEAQELFLQPKYGRRGATVIRALGAHPESGVDLNVMAGRFGPYVTDGALNASLPRGTDPEALTLEQAVQLLVERAAKAPTRPARRGAKKPAKKPAAKKTASKAAAAKKPATKKTATAKKTASGKAAGTRSGAAGTTATVRKPVVRKRATRKAAAS